MMTASLLAFTSGIMIVILASFWYIISSALDDENGTNTLTKSHIRHTIN